MLFIDEINSLQDEALISMLRQLRDGYSERLTSGWLFIFDRRTKAPSLEERLSTQITTTKNKRSVTVIRA